MKQVVQAVEQAEEKIKTKDTIGAIPEELKHYIEGTIDVNTTFPGVSPPLLRSAHVAPETFAWGDFYSLLNFCFSSLPPQTIAKCDALQDSLQTVILYLHCTWLCFMWRLLRCTHQLLPHYLKFLTYSYSLGALKSFYC